MLSEDSDKQWSIYMSFESLSSDFYGYENALSDQEKETIVALRAFLEAEVRPIVNGLWEKAEFVPRSIVKYRRLPAVSSASLLVMSPASRVFSSVNDWGTAFAVGVSAARDGEDTNRPAVATAAIVTMDESRALVRSFTESPVREEPFYGATNGPQSGDGKSVGRTTRAHTGPEPPA